ncbi:MAG: tRNA lysidine(34) synthetase TilS, partial [Alphaproteobacteria bacterium]
MPGALNLPIDAEEFARLLENYAPSLSVPLALAVSGGPDSMALAFCVKRWAQREAIAFIVDHGLRAESATEALQVKAALEQMGIRAEILRWEHETVTTGLHEKAREARYRLLTDACRRHGAADLLIAHHRDDQAETILMRLAKGSGVEGLAGMQDQTMRDGIRFLRPFLSLPKERLVATCVAAAIPFVTDPSNDHKKFARGRLRKILPALAEEGLTVESLIGLGARAAEAKEALDYYTKALLRNAAQTEIGGNVRI